MELIAPEWIELHFNKSLYYLNQYWAHCEQSHLSFVQIEQFELPSPIWGGCSSFALHSSWRGPRTKSSAALRELPKLWGLNYTPRAGHFIMVCIPAEPGAPWPELIAATTAAPGEWELTFLQCWQWHMAPGLWHQHRTPREFTQQSITVLGDETAEKGRKGWRSTLQVPTPLQSYTKKSLTYTNFAIITAALQ